MDPVTISRHSEARQLSRGISAHHTQLFSIYTWQRWMSNIVSERREILPQRREDGSRRLHVEVKVGETLLEALRSQSVNLISMCGGRGTCGKCRIVVPGDQGNLSSVTQTEKTLLSRSEVESGYRLACLTRPVRPSRIEVVIPPESEETQQRLMVSGLTPRLKLIPAVRKLFVRLPRPTLKDTTADLERLIQALSRYKRLEIQEVGYSTLRELPGTLRAKDWEVTVSVFKEKEIIKVEPGDKTDSCYGFAVDIGTTKLAGYLIDLRTGQTASTVSSLNPQSKFGSDIISRITYSMRSPDAVNELTECIVDGLNKLIYQACQNLDLSTEEIIDVAVAGNTAMHHFFLGVSPRHLSLSPYPAALRRAMEMRAADLGLKTAPDSKVYIFPVVAGFVGGDAVADIIATEIYSAEQMSMLIDIGTNAEIVLGTKKELIACSCASGPAFEGAHIKHGMRAAEGAIERIWIDPQSFDVSYRVVGTTKPVGICGSAIVEGVAEMFRVGIVDSRGRIQDTGSSPRFRETNGVREIVIVKREEAGIDDDIVITQSDVREIQLAKAAVYTGISTLMKHMHVKPSMIKRVFLAGAFGTYVDPSSARDIGMFPEIPLDRIQFVGNTAGAGARMALASRPTRELAQRTLKKIRYVELGADPDFQKEFVSAIDLPNARKELFPTVNMIIRCNLAISKQGKGRQRV